MPTYIGLVNWTEQGIKTFRDSPSRAEKATQEFERLGVKIREVYWTLGPYDIVTVVEAPDDETVTAALLALGSQGNVRTTTLRAFNRDEFNALVQKLG